MGMGWKAADLSKPQIMVESSYGDSHPGSAHLNIFVEEAVKGVDENGGKAARYYATDMCDGMSQGHDGINYSLAHRDAITNLVEAQANATTFDGGVFIASCDKAMPAMLMSIGRLKEMSAIVVTGGVMEATVVKPEYVENFMKFIAEELREYMAKLGCRTVDEMVGRSDLLKVREDLTGREKELDLSRILNNPYAGPKEKVTFDPKHVYDFELEKSKDETVLLKQLGSALANKHSRSIDVEVTNTDRSLGTIFGSEITKKYGTGLEEDTFVVKCTGAGGQSFGAFIPKGLTLELVGDSNDYFGKGLSGGKLVVYAPAGVKYKKDENIIIGNVALYGATSGKAFISGVAGERFCVRNSGASAVVEGVGDHGCEYMTGGRVVVLGKTGKNFAAGMSGGIAYVLDEDNDLYTRMNKEMVFSEEVSNKYDVMELKDMIKEHVAFTNSEKGKEILDNFSEYLPKFKKVIPYDYNRMLMAIVQMEEKGLSSEQAQIEAFYANTRG